MRPAFVVVAGALALGVGLVLGYASGYATADTTTVTTTTTETQSVTYALTELSLPAAVERTRGALRVAANAGDYEALRPFIPESGFDYTFGGQVEGGPIAYWEELERTTGEKPLEILEAILELPYVLSRGTYVWPWAYTVESVDDLSEHERALLAPLGELETFFVPGTGYLGWRTGIEHDGTWSFFVAGD